MLTDEQIAEGRRRLDAVKDGYRGSDITSWDAWAFNHADALLNAAAENAKLRAAIADERRKREVLAGEVRAWRWAKDCPIHDGVAHQDNDDAIVAARAATDASGALEKP